MGDRANVIVVRETGTYELYRTGRAVGIDLDLLDGPAAVLAMLPELRRDGGRAGKEAVAGNTVAARHPASLVWRRQGRAVGSPRPPPPGSAPAFPDRACPVGDARLSLAGHDRTGDVGGWRFSPVHERFTTSIAGYSCLAVGVGAAGTRLRPGTCSPRP